MAFALPGLWVVLGVIDLLGNRGYRPERVARWSGEERAEALTMLRGRRGPFAPGLTTVCCAAGAAASAAAGLARTWVWLAAATVQLVSALARRRTLARLQISGTEPRTPQARRRTLALVWAATVAMVISQVAAAGSEVRGDVLSQVVAAGGGFTGLLLALAAGWSHVWLPVGGMSSVAGQRPRAGGEPDSPPSATTRSAHEAPPTRPDDVPDLPSPFTTRKSRQRAARSHEPPKRQDDDGTTPAGP